jgi:hypothetical protein
MDLLGGGGGGGGGGGIIFPGYGKAGLQNIIPLNFELHLPTPPDKLWPVPYSNH